jgi:hypothetical protein
LQQHDAAVRAQQGLRKRAAAAEEAHKANVSLFTKVFLSLGAAAIKVVGSSHDAELAEAKGLAAARWNQ